MSVSDLRYGWILLDADGTLFDFESAQAAALDACLAEADLPTGGALLEPYRRIGSELWGLFEAGEITTEELRVRRFARLLEEAELRGDPLALSEDYLVRLAQRRELLPGALDAVRRLSEAGCRLWLATNGLAEVQRPRFADSPILKYVDGVVISEDVGAAKPQKAFFDEAFRRMGGPPKERTLMVGDSWSADVAGGLGYGLDVCWINPEGLPRLEAVELRAELAGVGELPDVVLGPAGARP